MAVDSETLDYRSVFRRKPECPFLWQGGYASVGKCTTNQSIALEEIFLEHNRIRKISILSASMIVNTWGVINISLPALSAVYSNIPLPLVENLSTITPLFVIIAVWMSHGVASRIGHKRTIQIGLLLVAISGLAPLVISNFYIMFFSRALLGFGIGLFQSLLVVMNRHFYQGEKRTQMFGFQSACEGLGGIVVTLLAGQLIKAGWRDVFWVYSLALLAFVLFRLFVPEIPMDSEELVEKTTEQKEKWRVVLLWEIGKYAILVFLLASIYMMMTVKVTSLMINLGYSNATGGATALLVLGGGAMLSGLLLKHVIQIAKAWLLIVAYAMFSASMFIIGFSQSLFTTCIGAFFCGFSFRTIIPYLLNKVNEEGIQSSKKTTSAVLIALNLGSFASPYLAVVFESIPGIPAYQGVFYVAAVVLAAFAIGALLLQLRAHDI